MSAAATAAIPRHPTGGSAAEASLAMSLPSDQRKQLLKSASSSRLTPLTPALSSPSPPLPYTHNGPPPLSTNLLLTLPTPHYSANPTATSYSPLARSPLTLHDPHQQQLQQRLSGAEVLHAAANTSYHHFQAFAVAAQMQQQHNGNPLQQQQQQQPTPSWQSFPPFTSTYTSPATVTSSTSTSDITQPTTVNNPASNAHLRTTKVDASGIERVGIACATCKHAKAKCDASRPCKRCVKIGKGDSCEDCQQKKRGRRKGSTQKAKQDAAAASGTESNNQSPTDPIDITITAPARQRQSSVQSNTVMAPVQLAQPPSQPHVFQTPTQQPYNDYADMYRQQQLRLQQLQPQQPFSHDIPFQSPYNTAYQHQLQSQPQPMPAQYTPQVQHQHQLQPQSAFPMYQQPSHHGLNTINSNNPAHQHLAASVPHHSFDQHPEHISPANYLAYLVIAAKPHLEKHYIRISQQRREILAAGDSVDNHPRLLIAERALKWLLSVVKYYRSEYDRMKFKSEIQQRAEIMAPQSNTTPTASTIPSDRFTDALNNPPPARSDANAVNIADNTTPPTEEVVQQQLASILDSLIGPSSFNETDATNSRVITVTTANGDIRRIETYSESEKHVLPEARNTTANDYLLEAQKEIYSKLDLGVIVISCIPLPFHPRCASPWVNRSVAALLGFTQAELDHRLSSWQGFSSLYHWQNLPNLAATFINCIMRGEGNYTIRSKWIKKDGSIIELLESVNVSYTQSEIGNRATALAPSAVRLNRPAGGSNSSDTQVAPEPIEALGSGIPSAVATLLQPIDETPQPFAPIRQASNGSARAEDPHNDHNARSPVFKKTKRQADTAMLTANEPSTQHTQHQPSSTESSPTELDATAYLQELAAHQVNTQAQQVSMMHQQHYSNLNHHPSYAYSTGESEGSLVSTASNSNANHMQQ